MGKRIYIEVEDRSPFGEEINEAMLEDAGIDSTYIEGYSDVRVRRDLAARRGEKPEPLRHRLQWARAKTADGSRAPGQRVMHWEVKKGYRTLPYDEAMTLGYNVKGNRGISRGEDGLCYLGESVLMIADAPTAAANLKKLERENRAQRNAAAEKMERSVAEFNRNTKGAHAEAFAFLDDDDPDEAAKRR